MQRYKTQASLLLNQVNLIAKMPVEGVGYALLVQKRKLRVFEFIDFFHFLLLSANAQLLHIFHIIS
jgi:hypothetical protein